MSSLTTSTVMVGVILGVALAAAAPASANGRPGAIRPQPPTGRPRAVPLDNVNTFYNDMYESAPVSWWRLDETSGTLAGNAILSLDGTYVNSPTLGQSGAIVNDTDTAIKVVSGSSQYVNVANNDLFSIEKARDSFDRTTSSGWGTADHGGSWTVQVGGASAFATNGSAATITQTTAGTYQAGITSISMTDSDMQVRGRWSVQAAGAATSPIQLIARQSDVNNFYRAVIKENTDHTLDLLIEKVVDGSVYLLASKTDIGSYTVGDWWYLRFQVEGTILRACAWKMGTTEPTAGTTICPTSSKWLCTTSTQFSAGTVAIRSGNGGATSYPVVSFESFWAECLGLTVQAWWRPDVLNFGTGDNTYINFLGKSSSGNAQWELRFHTATADEYDNSVDAYAFSLGGGLGASAGYEPFYQGALVAGTWYNIVAEFTSGDSLDQEAGVSIFFNSVLAVGPPSSGSLYWRYGVDPFTGTAPLTFGTTADHTSFISAGLDEIAIWNRLLSQTEITNLYNAALSGT